jgi:hypothetical protein
MIASKVICDDTYSNKSWGIVAQGMFSLREINQMEREMCSYLDWELTVDAKTLKTFEVILKKAFGGSEASKLSTSSPTSSTNSPMRGSLSYHRTCGGAGGGQLSQSQVLSAAYYDEAAATRLSSPSSLHPPENPLSSSIPSLATTNKFSPSPSLLVERGEWQKVISLLAALELVLIKSPAGCTRPRYAFVFFWTPPHLTCLPAAYVDTALSYLSTLAPMEDALRDQLCDTMLAIVSTSPYHDDGALRSAYSMRAMTQDLIESHGRLPLQAAAYAERPYRPLSPCLVHEDCVESDSLVSSLADLQSSPTGGTITPSASLEEPTGGNPFPTATPLIAYPPRSWSRGADAPVPVSVQGLLRHITGIPLDVRQHLEEGMPRRPSWEKANPKLLMSALVLLLTLVGTVVAILSLQAAKGVNNESKQ